MSSEVYLEGPAQHSLRMDDSMEHAKNTLVRQSSIFKLWLHLPPLQ